MKKNNVSWMVGGPAGYGILNAGMAFAKSLSRGGLYVFTTNKYPSLIRGGHNALYIRASDKELTSHTDKLDLVVALNRETIDLHKDDVVEGGGIIYDGDNVKVDDVKLKKGVKLFSVPLLKIAEEHGHKIMRNTVALGASMALMDYDIGMLEDVLASIFKKKGEEVVNNNKKVAKAGYDHIKEKYGDVVCKMSKVPKAPKRMVLNCNDAISMGALKAGLKLFAAYPMTPASSILHFMAKYERDMKIIVKHTEDELASMNTIIGGGFAGARSMTSTSGGGFALMSEAFGLAGMTETPCVVVNAQRGGPSTGLPTRQEQADLLFMVNASQGEFPRVIVAPGDVEEAFYETINVFNLTDKYQTPGIILTDKYNYASNKSVPFFNNKAKIDRGLLLTEEEAKKQKDYKRFKFVKNGVSPRARPGLPNTIFRATGNEHSEYGDITEDPNNRNSMVEKRMKKMEGLLKDIKTPVKLHGPEKADLTIVAWGSTKGPILEAMSLTNKKVNFLQILYPWPFPKMEVEDVLKKAKRVLLIEGNATAQMGELIRQQTGIKIEEKFLKYNGNQFYPIEIKEKIEEVVK